MPEIYSVVTATFNPLRTDDLREHAKAWVGVRTKWCAAWLIDAKDSSQYVGQMAMIPHEITSEGLPPLGWVPFCDLTDVKTDTVNRETTV